MITPSPSRPRNAAPAIPLLADRAYERIKREIMPSSSTVINLAITGENG